MNKSSEAVFLSYASQDVEAARRICEALRAAGVEVWFDQSELVGGDAWDAKIRKQIAECALFVPIISANTQARREGYFRIEWRLAAQRTHAISDDTPFLLPIVIDDTRDTDARVPAEFKAVQWTRLRQAYGGEARDDATVATFCARVVKLLGSGTGILPVSGNHGQDARATQSRAANPAGRHWFFPAFAGLVAIVALALWQPWKTGAPRAGATTAATPPISEASRLVAKAWEQMDKTEMARDELLLAEGYCRQAAALEETNPSVWAAWSAMSTWYHFHGFDHLPARKQAALDYAQKALALDPKSYEARYAWANYIVRMADKVGEERPALPVLRELLRERPDEPRALYALGFGLCADTANIDEGFAHLDRLAEKHPWFAGRALNELGWMALFHGRFALAESAAERAVNAQPYWNNLGLKATLALRLRGDVELAQATIDRLPPTALKENWGISLAVIVADWRGDHDRAVAVLQGVPRDWLDNFFFLGPTSLLSGLMRVKAKQATAAEKDFKRALELIAARLDQTPNDVMLLWCKAEALRLLGLQEEAKKTYSQLCEVWPTAFSHVTFEPPNEALNYVRQMARREYGLGEFPASWWFTAASLRLDPMLENVRRAPGFAALVEEVEQREKQRWTATPSPAGVKTGAALTERTPVADKAIAVLAFKNLSGDPAREALCEGLSDSISQVLGRVPGLRVAGSTSAFSFKGKPVPIPEIARQLGVSHLIEGTVLQDGAKVRIQAKLIKADGFQVWASENLEHELKNVFALFDEAAGLIAKQLSLKLGASSSAATASVNPQAFDLYVQARYAFGRSTEEGHARAKELLTRALALEQRFARAHAAMSDVLRNLAQGTAAAGTFSQRNGPVMTEILAEAQKAVDLDPDLPEARVALGAGCWMAWRLEEAKRELQHALTLNPNLAAGHHLMARVLLTDGRMDEALREFEIGVKLDPLFSRLADNYSSALYFAGRLEQSLVEMNRALALQPENRQARSQRIILLARLDRGAEAMAEIRQHPEIFPGDAAFALALAGERAASAEMLPQRATLLRDARALAALARHDECIAALQSGAVVANGLESLCFDPVFDPLRQEPRFLKLLEESGAIEAHARAQAWRKAHLPQKVNAKP